jgi:outer membrane immunogenic protein
MGERDAACRRAPNSWSAQSPSLELAYYTSIDSRGELMKKILTLGAAIGAMAFSATVALSADMETPAAFDWSGFYVGAYIGYIDFDTEIANVDNSFDGITGGAIAGFNHQIDQIVLGLEGDIGFTDADGNFALPVLHSQEVDMTYAVRARLGYAIDNTLLFVQGGVAFADFEANTPIGNVDDTVVGFQIGGGVEHAFTENFSVRLDALYSDYGSTENIPGTALDFDVESFTARVGVNFLF